MIQRRISIVLTAAALIAIWPSSGHAKFFGQVTSARVLDRGVQDVSGFVGFFDGATLVFGQLRRGFSTDFEGGAQFGLIDSDAGDVGLALGGDLKFGMLHSGPNQPLDLALDARTAYFNLDAFSVFELGGSIVLSHPYVLSRGSILEPYGAVNLRLERVSLDNIYVIADSHRAGIAPKGNADDSKTSLEIGAMGGVKWDISDLIDLLGEVVIDDKLGIIFGINFKI